MNALLNQFWMICLLRSGPQDLPAAYPLLKLTLFAYGLSGLVFLLGGVGNLNLPQAALLVVVDIALLAVLTYLVLHAVHHLPRFTQTLTALAGTGALLQLIALPLGVWFTWAEAAGASGQFPALLWLLLMIWSLTITGHILRHALSVSFGIGVLCALGYVFISWAVAEQIIVGM